MNATTYREFCEEVREILEYAPTNPGPVAPDLRGWWIPLACGEAYLCSRCAGRMLARSFNLPRNADPVWRKSADPYGVCVGCESSPLPPAHAEGGAK